MRRWGSVLAAVGMVGAALVGAAGAGVANGWASVAHGRGMLVGAQTAPDGSTEPVDTIEPVDPLAAVAGKIIVVDAGHNGNNRLYPRIINKPVFIGTKTITCDTTGTGSHGLTESAFNLDVALRLQAILESSGAYVVMTRTNDAGVGPCINERAAIGNRANADVGISIHADGGPRRGRGFHVIFPQSIPGLTAGIAADSYRLALDVRAAYQSGTSMPFATYIGSRNGLSQRNDLGGLNLSTVPKVFIETGNMHSAYDFPLLNSPIFRQQAAMALAQGLAAYLAGL